MNKPIRRHQDGMSLLVVLLLLVVMSVLGLAVLRGSAMQERMSANIYDRTLALQAAEKALAEAVTYLGNASASGGNWAVAVPTATTCANNSVCPTFTTAATWRAATNTGGSGGVPLTTAAYWIEYLGENQAHLEAAGVIPAAGTTAMGPLFRITAVSPNPSVTRTGRAAVTLQTDVIYRLPRL